MTFVALDCRKELKVSNSTLKDEAKRLLDCLPEEATWEDLQYAICVRQAIETGLKDSREGRTVTLEEARRRFDLGSPARGH